MRNPKFVRWGAVLLGLVVLRTKAQNGFCPMCTKGCHAVPTCSKHFWGQFWGQNGKADSHTHRSNKCATLVSLGNMNPRLAGLLRVKSPTNQYISFTLRQEVVRKPTLHHPPHRPCHREKRLCLGAFASYRRGSRPAKYRPKIPVQETPAQINKVLRYYRQTVEKLL